MSSFLPLILSLLMFPILLASSSLFTSCQNNVCFCDTHQTMKGCPEGCSDCDLSGSSLICSGCIANYWLNPETKLCDMANTCGIGGYYNESVNQCFLCPKGCHLCHCNQTCEYSEQLTCFDCLDGYFLNKNTQRCQLITCEQGFYLNPYDYKCYLCPQKCQDCLYDTPSDKIKCTDCFPQYFFDSNRSTCLTIEQCDPGFYYDSNVNKCFQCPKYCSECVKNGTFSPNCTSCIKDGLLKKGSCIPKPSCKDYFYFNNQTFECDPCPQNCTTCFFDSNESSIKCTGCWGGVFFNKTSLTCEPEPGCKINNGFFYNSSDNTCSKCPGNCSTCITTSNNQNIVCLTCPKNYAFDEVLNSCGPIPFCFPGTYYNNTENKCVNCPTNCSQCSNNICSDRIPCSSCVEGAFFNESYQTCDPIPICDSDNYYNNTDNTCNLCPFRCSTCNRNTINNEVECTACYPEGWLNKTEKLCDKKTVCTPGTYFNNSENDCFLCPRHCQECVEDDANIEMHNITCTSCFLEAFYNASFGSCQLRSICHNGSYYNSSDNWCYDCPENCTDCYYDESNTNYDDVSCWSCELEAFFNAEKKICEPIPSCENGVYYNGTDNLCHECPQFCNNCSSDGFTCYECVENAWLNPNDGICHTRKNCEGNTYYNKTEDTCFYCPFLCSLCDYDETNILYNNITCLQCNENGFYVQSSRQCEMKSQCKLGTYYKSEDNSCNDCPEECADCFYDETNPTNNNVTCTQCENQWHYVLQAGKCVNWHE